MTCFQNNRKQLKNNCSFQEVRIQTQLAERLQSSSKSEDSASRFQFNRATAQGNGKFSWKQPPPPFRFSHKRIFLPKNVFKLPAESRKNDSKKQFVKTMLKRVNSRVEKVERVDVKIGNNS